LTFREKTNKSCGEESDNDDEVESPLTTFAQALDSLQVLRKYIREQPEMPDVIFPHPKVKHKK